jgi:methionine-rich copper-binding protein CopC
LVKAVPGIDATIKAPPTALTLWFNERPDVVLSSLRLLGPDSTTVLLGATRAGPDPMAVMATVRGPLAAGKYTVLYRTAGPDGHVMRGRYQFTYQP